MPLVIARFSIIGMAVGGVATGAALALLCRSFLPPEFFAVLGVLLFGLGVYRRDAIWITDGRLFLREYPLRYTSSFATGDIEDVTLGEEYDKVLSAFQWTYVIIIKLRSGGKYTIGQIPLVPSRRIVLERLRDALGLPPAEFHG
jgi:hypothetical protein